MTDVLPSLEKTAFQLPSSDAAEEASRSLVDAAYDGLARVGKTVAETVQEHPYASVAAAAALSALALVAIRKFGLAGRVLATDAARAESSTSVFPHYVRKMDPAHDTLVIGKFKDLDAYKYLDGEFRLAWPTTKAALEKPKNLQLLDDWVLRGGKVKDISEAAAVKSPAEHLAWERGFLNRRTLTEGSYIHAPSGSSTPPGERLPWQSLQLMPNNRGNQQFLDFLRGLQHLGDDARASMVRIGDTRGAITRLS